MRRATRMSTRFSSAGRAAQLLRQQGWHPTRHRSRAAASAPFGATSWMPNGRPDELRCTGSPSAGPCSSVRRSWKRQSSVEPMRSVPPAAESYASSSIALTSTMWPGRAARSAIAAEGIARPLGSVHRRRRLPRGWRQPQPRWRSGRAGGNALHHDPEADPRVECHRCPSPLNQLTVSSREASTRTRRPPGRSRTEPWFSSAQIAATAATEMACLLPSMSCTTM